MPAIVPHDWRQLAEAARDEPDSKKLRQLVEQLNRELKERARSLHQRMCKNADSVAVEASATRDDDSNPNR
jgi:hypothetical protein